LFEVRTTNRQFDDRKRLFGAEEVGDRLAQNSSISFKVKLLTLLNLNCKAFLDPGDFDLESFQV
jgi:hypothetical protein